MAAATNNYQHQDYDYAAAQARREADEAAFAERVREHAAERQAVIDRCRERYGDIITIDGYYPAPVGAVRVDRSIDLIKREPPFPRWDPIDEVILDTLDQSSDDSWVATVRSILADRNLYATVDSFRPVADALAGKLDPAFAYPGAPRYSANLNRAQLVDRIDRLENYSPAQVYFQLCLGIIPSRQIVKVTV